MILKDILLKFSETPITFQYTTPSPSAIEGLKTEQKPVILSASEGLILDQTYFRAGHVGTSPFTFTRLAVANKIHEGVRLLQPHFGITVFDAYRSIQTQRALLEFVAKHVRTMHPTWPEKDVQKETRKFVFDPDDKTRVALPPHNSGGAIDLALHINGELIDFGTGFDSPSDASATAFFESDYQPNLGHTLEQWNQVRVHRRILFHTMIHLGFTNYPAEWWHYDLGDCPWSKVLGLPWVFDSMESQVVELGESLKD